MKNIKIGFLWCADVKNQVIFKILEKVSNSKLIITEPSKCDILFIGSYDHEFYSLKRKIFNKALNKKIIKNFSKTFHNLDLYSLRKFKPIRIFITTEPLPLDKNISYDFGITPFFEINSDNHLRYPLWKESLDWSEYEIDHYSSNIKRHGRKINIDNLMEPMDMKFEEKKKEMCMFTSHLNYPRDIIYKKFNKEFQLDGYGKFFDKSITNHNKSNFFKYDILKNYKFNLCPANTIFPGYYTQDIVESFDASCLPITWSDQNISEDFNKNSLVNLNDNFSEIKKCILNLKDENYLKKFMNEPLFNEKPNLENEFNFMKKIIDVVG
tara:strand:- start:4835 stop:5806 length:972 start_codon:yes stop_codon:yes gene_type:complete